MIGNVRVIIDNEEEVCASQFTELNGEYTIQVKTLEPKSKLRARIQELEKIINDNITDTYNIICGKKIIP